MGKTQIIKNDLSLSEKETHFSISARDRLDEEKWTIFTDDSVMDRKLRSAGAKIIREELNEEGDVIARYLTLDIDKISFG